MENIEVFLFDKNGGVQYGLNWGQREGRDPDQAYLQLTPEVYRSNFFPVKKNYFVAETDDGETLIFNRGQKGEDGCALETPDDNAKLGRYLRKRLGVSYGKKIEKEDIENYGRSSIIFYKIDDMHYKFDFSKYSNTPISLPLPRNRIIFGAPGTGKSHLLEQQRKNYFNDEHYERVTFHPNYSYAQFVGAYKPVTKITDGKENITYSFVPGPFVRMLAKAIKNPSENFLLVIEEINRANVAAVFGDVFQLLDRDEDGKSEYSIDAGEDLKKHLGESDVPLEGGKIAIPANMYIWATMNSADQGVMPLDAAFKRRWEFEYIGIDENENQVADYEIPKTKNPDGSFTFVRWNVFRKALNGKLKNLSGASVNEDKLLGPFFISRHSLETAKDNTEDFIRLFKSKILMYLYEDVCKMNPHALFKGIPDGGRLHYSDVRAAFDEKGLEIFGVDFLGKSDD
ncbi:MAG: AAA domain-containing protein [Treponema sp.]|nr:AAA domain-containing protein [Treponema sp.]